MEYMSGRRVVWRTPNVSADGLKLFACVMMLLHNFGVIVIEHGMIHLEQYTQETLAVAMEQDSHLMMLAGIGSVLQLLGGLAVPVFGFLLVEGFLNTSDYKKYLINILVFALLSEIPYDLAHYQKYFDFTGQNALLTMAICLMMLYCLRVFREAEGILAILIRLCIVAGAVAWVTLFRAEYGLCMVLLTAIFYIFYSRNGWKTFLGVLVSCLYIPGPLSFYGIWCYTGERKDRLPKYVYYALYPLQLFVMAICAMRM